MAIQHIVIDLETMSTKATAAITSIGAVRLNEDFTLAENAYFYERVSLESSMLQGLDVDAGTIRFWMSQEDEARAELYKDGAQQLHPALARLSLFIDSCSAVPHVWGYGPEFDNVILANAYTATGLPLPWHYRNNRSLRELRHMYPNVDVPHKGVAHNALDDAKWQAHMLHAIMTHHSTTVPKKVYDAETKLAMARRDLIVLLKADTRDEDGVVEFERRVLEAEECVMRLTLYTNME